MIPRSDLRHPLSPSGLEVFQLTSEVLPASHVYMEAQVFTPDSKRLIVHRSATAHGGERTDPEHRYLLCDLEDGGRLTPLTSETGAWGPMVSPDGRWFYYFVDQTVCGAGGRLTLNRVGLDGSERESLFVIDGVIPGTDYRPSRVYPLATISSDGRRIAVSAFLGDGRTAGAPWGLLVFDLERMEVRVPLAGPTWWNMHPQYCRSSDPQASHDLLVQENHGAVHDALGTCITPWAEPGPDIHIVRDDGTELRTTPCGRDGIECCQGHQCWRGQGRTAVIGTSFRPRREFQLIEISPGADQGHVGVGTPGAWRRDLTRDFPSAHCFHFATDAAGRTLITDQGPAPGPLCLYVAAFSDDPTQPLQKPTFLLDSRTRRLKTTHVHPFLSPDGRMGFFNSDESGVLQAYMVRGFASA